jgi:Zn-dependent alcohol dehydrogenase
MKGRLPIDRLQKQYKPAEINIAVQDLLAGKVMKPVIVWSSPNP